MAIRPAGGAYNVPPGPSVSGFAITKSDATVFAPTRAVWVGGAGDIAVLMNGDTVVVTLIGVPAGTMLPISVTKVMAATTATNIVGLT